MKDAGMGVGGKECLRSVRIVKGENPEELIDYPAGVGLELWGPEEGRAGEPKWCLSASTDYRPKLGETIRVPIDDETAGWLLRKFAPEGV